MEQPNDYSPCHALDAAIDAARLATPVVDHDDGRKHVFVPNGYDLKEVTDPNHLPPHIKQKITVDDRPEGIQGQCP